MATRAKKQEGTGEPAPARHIQSIPLGFKLVQALQLSNTPLTLKEVAAAVGMDAGHAHLYLASFKMIGLVQQAGNGGAYTLGRYALELGLAALRKLDLVEVAREPLLELQHETGLTAYLSIWGNLGPTIISKADGNFPFPMSIRVGYVLPILNTATGRVFLSYLPPATTQELVVREAQTMRGPNGAKLDGSPAALNDIVAQIRSRGIAQTGSAINAGFAGMATPLFDHEAHICATLSILGPVGAFDVKLNSAPARALKHKAQALSQALGYSGERAPDPGYLFK